MLWFKLYIDKILLTYKKTEVYDDDIEGITPLYHFKNKTKKI